MFALWAAFWNGRLPFLGRPSADGAGLVVAGWSSLVRRPSSIVGAGRAS